MTAEHFAVVTFLFTDVVRSTERLHALGDDRAEELRRAEHQLLQSALGAAGGREVKNLGDGVMAAFVSPLQAVSCAIAIQESVRRRNLELVEYERSAIRVGLHAGEAVWDEGDFQGRHVVLAKRLCDCAGGGQIYASSLMQGLIGTRGGHQFRELGLLELKGFPTPVQAFEVLWQPDVPSISQITILLPNRPAALHAVSSELARQEIGLRAFHVANAGQTGFVQLVCTPHEKAMDVLRDQFRHYLLEGSILAVRIDDRTGALNDLLEVVAGLGFNICQSYLAFDGARQPVAMIEFDDPVRHAGAGRALLQRGYVLLRSLEQGT